VIESVEDANCLSTAIANHAELSFVNLSSCGLGEVHDPIRLELVLNGCKKLKSLIIDGNLIHGASLRVVADFLTVTTELTVFSMDNYRLVYRWARKNRKNGIILETDDVKALTRALKANTSLRQVCLGRNGLRLPSFMSKSVIKNLTHLDLSGNEMRAPGAKVVAQFLSHNRNMTELNLADNQIPSAAASALGAALKRNTTLEHLDLSSNSFTDKCVPAFGKFKPILKYWRVALPCIALTTLILCLLLVDALKNNRTLLSLDLGDCNIKIVTGRKVLIHSALCDTTSLQAIVDSNHVCQLTVSSGKSTYMNYRTQEDEMKNINALALEDEGKKIRYKVVLALFTTNPNLFNPRGFDDVPLELMPRLLEIAQQDLGHDGFGLEICKRSRCYGRDPTLGRIYEVMMGWNTPLLFVRGPGELPRKKKQQRKVLDSKVFEKKKRKRMASDDDDEWKPTNQ
jgi:Ran GTPase-activating protein (RanGAP) involved in mRNA processing and transport